MHDRNNFALESCRAAACRILYERPHIGIAQSRHKLEWYAGSCCRRNQSTGNYPHTHEQGYEQCQSNAPQA